MANTTCFFFCLIRAKCQTFQIPVSLCLCPPPFYWYFFFIFPFQTNNDNNNQSLRPCLDRREEPPGCLNVPSAEPTGTRSVASYWCPTARRWQLTTSAWWGENTHQPLFFRMWFNLFNPWQTDNIGWWCDFFFKLIIYLFLHKWNNWFNTRKMNDILYVVHVYVVVHIFSLHVCFCVRFHIQTPLNVWSLF